MSKILLTGMTASQASPNANNKSLEFAGVLYKTLTELGHNVTWGDPNINSTPNSFNEFDAVLVGISPITSLSANRAYGALATIEALWDSPKLSLFIDSSTVSQIGVSLSAVANNPDNLVKEFFSYRKGFTEVKANTDLQKRILSVVDKLLNSEWPKTMYPALPWSEIGSVTKNLPEGAAGSLSGINLDSYLLTEPAGSESRVSKWVYDIPSPHWTKKTLATTKFPGSPMKINKGTTDSEVSYQVSRSLGVLISSDKRQGTWWTYRYIQALNSGTPVATEWRESSRIGSTWSELAPTIEEYSEDARVSLANSQRTAYVQNIPSKIEAGKNLQDLLNISKENNAS